MYLTPTKNHWAIDIETDDLRDKATVIYVACVENCVTDEKLHFTDKDKFNEWLPKEAIFVGHNLVAFDIPLINKFWGSRVGASRLVDTFVLSMLYSPSLQGGHSLEAWGLRVKLPKLPFKDFSNYSEEMLTYCQRDTEITKRVFNRLSTRMRTIGFSERGAALETQAWNIIQNKQRRYGFPFDYERAHKLYVELRAREEELKREIYKQWPPEERCIATYKRAYKGDGSPSANYRRHLEQFPRIEVEDSGDYRVYDLVEFNLGSPKQRVTKLLEAGWTPTSYTKAGNPQVNEESLLKFAESSGNEGGTLLAKWVVINSRANMINNWMNSYNERTRAIHGNLWLAGTLRYRHDNPNSANIPAVRMGNEGPLRGEAGAWTYESRDLYTCGDRAKYSLVGVDAKGIQLRVLAHYLEDEEFTKAILSEDPHTANQIRLGLSSRALTKTIVYATLMGAGDSRISSEATVSLKEAKAAKKKFFEQVPGLPKLISRLQGQLERTGRITLCDGTPILVSSPHMVIPYLLQGDESRIMKQAMIFTDEEVRRNKIEAYKAADVHDEWQTVVLTEQLPLYRTAALGSFPRAGQSFDYRVPIEGDMKVGKTWAETH